MEVKAVAAGHNTSPAHPDNFDAPCLVRLDPENLGVRYAVLMSTDVAIELGRPPARGFITLRATNQLPQHPGCRGPHRRVAGSSHADLPGMRGFLHDGFARNS